MFLTILFAILVFKGKISFQQKRGFSLLAQYAPGGPLLGMELDEVMSSPESVSCGDLMEHAVSLFIKVNTLT